MKLSNYAWLIELNEELKQFVTDDIIIKVVAEDWERHQYFQLREATFRDEQKILKEDRDGHDFKALAIVAGNMIVSLVLFVFSLKLNRHGGAGVCVLILYTVINMQLVKR